MLCYFLNCFLIYKVMIFNDMKSKVEGKFSREVVIDDASDEITYVFPDTKEFINVLRRSINRKLE